VSAGRKVRIEGAKELRSKIRKMDDGLERTAAKGDMKATHKEAADAVLDKALSLVPVRSGNLKSTLRSSATQMSGRVRAGFARVPYAGPIHFGWPARGIQANPFLYDSLDWRRYEVLEIYDRNIERIRDKYRL
jgi:hypothetical protein